MMYVFVPALGADQIVPILRVKRQLADKFIKLVKYMQLWRRVVS